MNKKTKNILIILAVAMCSIGIMGCEKDFAEDDIDLLTGKWRSCEVLEDSLATREQLLAYTEFSPYSYNLKDRKITYYTCKIVTDSSLIPPETIYPRYLYGNYTLSGDTLTIKDSVNITKQYYILYISGDSMAYKDFNGNKFRFKRYKG